MYFACMTCPFHSRFLFSKFAAEHDCVFACVARRACERVLDFGASVPSQLKSLSELAEEERVSKQKVIDDEAAALAAMASTS